MFEGLRFTWFKVHGSMGTGEWETSSVEIENKFQSGIENYFRGSRKRLLKLAQARI